MNISTASPSVKKWTMDQQKAISYDGDNLMLLAAAGSGKTAVLTERVVKLITDGKADISRMLIVTFTNAAADELRVRIRDALEKKLRENPGDRRLLTQLIDLEHADICTILSFCMGALKPHFAEFSLPPDFRVADEASSVKLRQTVMRQVTDSLFNSGDEGILRLADCFGAARDEHRVDEQLCLVADGLTSLGLDAQALFKWADSMERASKRDFFDTVYGEEAKRTAYEFFDHFGNVFSHLYNDMEADEAHPAAFEKYGAAAHDCRTLCEQMKKVVMGGSYIKSGELLRLYSPVGLKRLKSEEQSEESLVFKEIRKKFLEKIKKLSSSLFGTAPDEISRLLLRSGELCRDCGAVMELYFQRYTNEKCTRGTVDFSDLESYAKRLFVNTDGTPTAAAREMSLKYDYVFVDEYQDTNVAQDQIFAAVAGDSGRFLVGDMKQSIYAFRGAVPEVFGSYREKWSSGDGGNVIFMSDNFRCDVPVIDFVNLVSDHLFSYSATPFDENDRLKASKKAEGECSPVEICIIEKDQSGVNREAVYVAERINELLSSGFLRDGKPVSADDIAILLRSSGARSDYESELARLGIPVKNRKIAPFYENPSVRMVMCILHSVDNPANDIYLAGAMKSPVFKFTAEELAAVRDWTYNGTLWYAVRRYCGALSDVCSNFQDYADSNEIKDSHVPALEYSEELAAKLRNFCMLLYGLREKSRGGSAVKFINYVYNYFGIMHLCEESSRAADQKALRRLYETARGKCASEFCSLYGFLTYMDDLIETGEKPAEEAEGSGVSIISIHHSKGLEFPVCFVSDTGRKFNTDGSSDNVLLDGELGMAARIPDQGGLIRCDTPLRQAISARRRRMDTEEEMRVAYVALTRARERLIITGQTKDPEALLRTSRNMHPFTSVYSVVNAGCMLRWITDSISSSDSAKIDYTLKIINADGEMMAENANPETSFALSSMSDELKSAALSSDLQPYDPELDALSGEYAEIFSRRFAFHYPYEPYVSMPAKLTVSKLYPSLLDSRLLDGGGEIRMSVDKKYSEMKMSPPYPRFMSEETPAGGAQKGTATHVFMQFCDFASFFHNGAEHEIARLLNKGFITEGMALLIERDEIEKFRRSNLLQRILSARRIWREFRFNASMPAARFTEDEALRLRFVEDGADVTVQGVVDCMFEDESGKIVLADYKTDRLTADEISNPEKAAAKLTARHKNQLTYYAEICSAMLERPIDEVYIYSLPLGDVIPLEGGTAHE